MICSMAPSSNRQISARRGCKHTAATPPCALKSRRCSRAHDETDAIFDRHALHLAAPLVRARPLERIGSYRVLRELGRGGMGVVYLAERDDGQYRQRVAIKALRNTPDTEELHRRFVAERQILASLNHPNIAQLLDGGVTDGHLPFLVMEYVDGRADHDVLRPTAPHGRGAAQSLPRCLRRGAPRASKPRHPSRHQAEQHPRHERGAR